MGQIASHISAIIGGNSTSQSAVVSDTKADDASVVLDPSENSDSSSNSDSESPVFSPQQTAAAEAESAREYAIMGNLTTHAATALAVNESRFEAEVMGGFNEDDALAEAIRRSASEDVQDDDLVSDESGDNSSDEYSDPRHFDRVCTNNVRIHPGIATRYSN